MILFVCSTIDDSSDREFILWIYEEFQRLMFSTARKYTEDQSSCEDIVQDSLVRLIDKVDTLREKKRCILASYIVSTVKNTSINYMRKQNVIHKHIVSYDADNFQEPASPDIHLGELVHKKDIGEKLLSVLQQLSETDQLLLEGKYILDYSDAELAVQLGCKASSIRMKLTRARRNALVLLSEQYWREEIVCD